VSEALLYPVALKRNEGPGPTFHVLIPDIEGCDSTGMTLYDALHNARRAVRACIADLLKAGKPVPPPSSDIEMLAARPEFAGLTWAMVSI
jgi:predicted RNase H-like HicB family nuclease